MDHSGWSPAERRRDVVSWSLEIAAGVALGALLTLGRRRSPGPRSRISGLAEPAGLFPDLASLFTSLPGLLAGDPAAGLDYPPSPAPPGWLLGATIASVELAMICAAAALGRLAWARWGPGRLPGTARRGEVAPLLGFDGSAGPLR